MDLHFLMGLLGTFVGAALLSVFLIPLARRAGLVDVPDARKSHLAPTPLTGGIAMFVAFTVGVALAGMLDVTHLFIMTGAGLLVVVGMIDDRRHIRVGMRFLAQAVAAGFLVIGAGVRVDSLGNLFGFGSIELGLFSIPFSIFAVVGMVNAINMLDGLDGLAGSVVLVVLAAIVTLGVAAESDIVMPALILATTVLGFLLLNFRFPGRARAHVFMGDAGSNFLGYCLAWFVIALPQQAPEIVAPIHMIWLVGFPVADTLTTMWSRLQQGSSPFHPGHDHAHSWLTKAGAGTQMTVVILSVMSLAYALVGINGALHGWPPEPTLSYLFVIVLVVMASLSSRVALVPKRIRRYIVDRLTKCFGHV